MSKKRKPEKLIHGDVKTQLARALADYDNLKKRVEKERGQFVKVANLTLVARLLPILDMLESAQTHLGDSGLAITIKEFKEILAEEGIEEIKAQPGTEFSEEVHEVVETSQAKGKKGEITKVLLSGWRFSDGPVIRPARVEVGK